MVPGKIPVIFNMVAIIQNGRQLATSKFVFCDEHVHVLFETVIYVNHFNSDIL